MKSIDHDSPPVEGPFTVVWDGMDHLAPPGTPWERRTQEVATEQEAVNLWQTAVLYANMRPVDISPEPRWNQYTYDGHTPLKR